MVYQSWIIVEYSAHLPRSLSSVYDFGKEANHASSLLGRRTHRSDEVVIKRVLADYETEAVHSTRYSTTPQQRKKQNMADGGNTNSRAAGLMLGLHAKQLLI